MLVAGSLTENSSIIVMLQSREHPNTFNWLTHTKFRLPNCNETRRTGARLAGFTPYLCSATRGRMAQVRS